MATLSTHVLDTAVGRPAAGIRVALETSEGARSTRDTDDDGRVASLGGRPRSGCLRPPVRDRRLPGSEAFYPEVVVGFRVGTDDHYHVPLLLSPFGYSTYRGS